MSAIIDFVRKHLQLFVLVMLWVVVTVYLGPLVYLLLPASLFLMRTSDRYADILFGFIAVLVMSDMDPDIVAMDPIKTAKNFAIIALSIMFFMDRGRFGQLSGVFPVFLPFFVFSILPLVFSNRVPVASQKTLSYALLFLVVPNWVLMNFRTHGWDFVRNLIFFLCLILLVSPLLGRINQWYTVIDGRYRGIFGNPNGLGIFCFLSFLIVAVSEYMNKDLFPNRITRWIVYGIILFNLVRCGSRTSLTATLMFVMFSRFFSVSPFIGFIIFLSFVAGLQYLTANLANIVIALGLQEFMRVDTLEDGSGRYFAWAFAWEKIQGYFLMGGGFGNDEYVMRQNYEYLRSQGHHGGVHNSYLTMWFNVGIIGVLIYMRSLFVIFVKASKHVPIAFAVLFSIMFSALYESWLNGSLNPFTILVVIVITLMSEVEIADPAAVEEPEADLAADAGPVPGLVLPAR
ncbi:MAG: O-antigen ligase family protein [Flavobacteriales bacterium]|nr:MAG: O-antigen ligase family protein [Flavobacteriales bacterium]